MKIIFDLEARDEGAAFFAIYAGIRMYYEQKKQQPKFEGAFYIAEAEAYSLLKELQVKHPKEYAEAEIEYNETYQWTKDVVFVQSILPEHYDVRIRTNKVSPDKEVRFIRCTSKIGIRKNGEQEDDEHWSYFMKALKSRFGNRFQEVDHHTCTHHSDFNIYLKEATI